MGKILEAFLSDQLRVDNVRGTRTPERRRLGERGCELQSKLGEKLDDEGKGMLTELVNILFTEGCHESQDKFIRGYQLGALMTMEILSEQDIFL